MEVVLRIALGKFSVDRKVLAYFVQTTSTLYRKPRTQRAGTESILNKVDELLFEIIASGLRLRARLSAATVQAIIEVSITS